MIRLLIAIIFISLFGCSTKSIFQESYGCCDDNLFYNVIDNNIGDKPDLHTMVYFNNYTDTVFPSENILKFNNLSCLCVYGLDNRLHDNLKLSHIPQKLIIDTNKLNTLNKIKVLELGWFDLSVFPNELLCLKNLKSLLLDCCLQDSIPKGICNLPNIEVLTFRLNNISDVPPWLTEIKKLRVIDLGNNTLKHIPLVLAKCDSLQIINLANQEGYFVNGIENYDLPVNRISYLNEISQLENLLTKENIVRVIIEVHNANAKKEIKKYLKEKGLDKKIRIMVRRMFYS